MQKDISGLSAFLSDLDAKFVNYEKGNPYWDKSVTFTLEDEDLEAEDEAEANGGSEVNLCESRWPRAHERARAPVRVC